MAGVRVRNNSAGVMAETDAPALAGMAEPTVRRMYPVGTVRNAPAPAPCPGRRADAGARRRRRRLRPASLPLVLLLLALSALFLFGHDRGYFYRIGDGHDWDSSKMLTHAANFSFEHNLLVFHYLSQDADGNPAYPQPYSRFPIGGYVLLKLAIQPFGDGAFGAQIYAGRMLMLLLFSAAAVLAYHALARISGSRWDALTATLLAFSSYYLLYYSDMISNEITTDLFAVMLAFHGMAVFIQEGRFRQLLVKSCLALLLGWHVYAFLLPFILLGLAYELLKSQRILAARALAAGPRLRAAALTMRRSRYLSLGVVTLWFGIALLTFNFGNEYFTLDRGGAPWEIPSAQSMFKRFGWSESFNAKRADRLEPRVFVPNQTYRIGNIMLPYAVNPYEIKRHTERLGRLDYPAVAVGSLAVGLCVAGLLVIRRRPGLLLPLATLAASGICWALALRHNVVEHDYESVYYIGIPLTVFILALLYLRKLFRTRLAPFLAMAAAAVFIVSASQMAGVGQHRQDLAADADQMADYAVIRSLVADGAAVYFPEHSGQSRAKAVGGAAYAVSYFMAGKALIYADTNSEVRPEEQPIAYLLLPLREDNPALLTPDNRRIFLYQWSPDAEPYRVANLSNPIIAADWTVHLGDRRLTYVSPECSNLEEVFFLHIFPRHQTDLPADRKEYGYDSYDFRFHLGGGIRRGQTCVIEHPFPEYDIASIRTGQYIPGERHIWIGEYDLRH